MSTLRILLAEDHETVRDGLRLLIDGQPDMEVVGEVGNGRLAVQLARELLPDVVVMDISMPEMNGLVATMKVKEACPEVKVLTLTRHAEEGYLRELLRAGASGYVLKQSTSAELLRAIRTVASDGRYLDPAVTETMMRAYVGRYAKHEPRRQPSLSDRETETLRLIAWGHSNKEIAAQLGISVKTVEVHKANAMKKLGIRSRIDIVRFALLQGWLQDT